jgi:hypothetical protein
MKDKLRGGRKRKKEVLEVESDYADEMIHVHSSK